MIPRSRWISVLLTLGLGVGVALALAHPLGSTFASLLGLKIVLALSIIGHYLLLAFWLLSGRLSEGRALGIRRSILGHMVLIVILAKAMFYWH